jgi:RNA polymerase-interacting CarD/CdnL/TRCF family regulator
MKKRKLKKADRVKLAELIRELRRIPITELDRKERSRIIRRAAETLASTLTPRIKS